MGQAFLHGNGGSNPLNIKVVASATEPSNPKEYTIWVETSVAIPWWEMGVYGYGDLTWDDDAGCVYFKTNIVEYGAEDWFNPIKKNTIDLGITETVQNQGTYDNPNWVRCNAYLYKNGAWVQISSTFAATINVTCPAGSYCGISDTTDGSGNNNILMDYKADGNYTISVPFAGTWYVIAFIVDDAGAWTHKATEAVTISNGQTVSVELTYFDGYLFNYGSVNTDVTGGWKSDGGGTVTAQSDGSVRIAPTENYDQAIYHTINKIDLTNYSTLIMNGKMWNYGGGNGVTPAICVWSAVTYDNYSNGLAASVGPGGNISTFADHSLDISSLSGSYYVGIASTNHPDYQWMYMCTMRLE